MRPSWWEKVEPVADEAIVAFGGKLRKRLAESPAKIIARKNPFLFRVRVVSDVRQYATMIVNAHLSSSEETMFGNTLETLAVTICEHAKGGRKSGIAKIDLEYEENQVRNIIQIKSGENWGNSSQRERLVETFNGVRRILRQGNSKLNIQCIEGICYGRSATREKGTHVQLVGGHFWRDISGWEGTADGVMDLLGHHASNGLIELRIEAEDRMVEYLRGQGAVDLDGSLRWYRLLDLVMQE